MAASVGTVSIDLRAETARFNQQLKEASAYLGRTSAKMNRSVRQMTAGWTGMARSVSMVSRLVPGLGGALAGLNLARLANESTSFADSIAKTADKIGLTTGELQELRFGAERAGVASNTLDMAMQRFSRRVGEAAQGSGELKDTLQTYNIRLRDSAGVMRPLVDILGDYSNAIKNAESNQEQLRLAFKGFDSEGAALVNMLRDGSAGMDQMRAQAQALGVVLSDSTVRGAEKARDAIDIFAEASMTKMREMGNLMARMFTGMDWVQNVVDPMKAAAAELEKLSVQRGQLQQDLATGGAMMFTPGGDLLIERENSELDALNRRIAIIRNRISQLRAGPVMAGPYVAAPPSAPAMTSPVIPSIAAPAAPGIPARKPQATIGASVTDYTAQMDALNRRSRKMFVETEAQARRSSAQMTSAFQGVAEQGLDDAIVAGLASAKTGFKDLGMTAAAVLEGILSDVIRVSARMAIFGQGGLATPLFAGSGAGGVQPAGSLTYGGPRAAGGPVSPGKIYRVGERGPEAFVPNAAGQIVPGGGGVDVTIHNHGAEVETSSSQGPNGRQQLQIMIRRGLQDMAGTGALDGILRPLGSKRRPVDR